MTKATSIVSDSPSQSMDDETLAALRASIQHWRENVEAETPNYADVDADSCALCVKFFDLGCDGCPVAERTGEAGCRNTPYWDSHRALFNWIDGYGSRLDWRDAAQAELDFLISLLPEGERS